MKKRYLFYTNVIADIFVIATIFYSAAGISLYLAEEVKLTLAGALAVRTYMFLLPIMQVLVWYYAAEAVGLYDNFNLKFYSDHFTGIIKISLVQAITAVIFIFLTKEALFTRNFIFFIFLNTFLLLSFRVILIRLLSLRVFRITPQGKNLLIIGGGEGGSEFAEFIEQNPGFGYVLQGFVTNEDLGQENHRVIGKLEELDNILKERRIEEVVISLTDKKLPFLMDIIKTCEINAVRIYLIPAFLGLYLQKFQFSTIGNFPLMKLRKEPLEAPHWQFLKRVFDIFGSLLVIIFVTSWLFPIIILIQRIKSPGPVFFIQPRVGINKENFQCYKFRSMQPETNANVYNPAKTDDIRITAFGKFLRKTNLDETPQIFNVLLGDMSLVGPRPHPLPYNQYTKEVVDEMELRYLVKPGITGWAQIHGLRGDVTEEDENRLRIRKKLQYDLWYIENWTFWLDIQILIATVRQILTGKNMGY